MPVHEICVLAGGWSGERAVSLRSGAAVVDACRALGYRTDYQDIAEVSRLKTLLSYPDNTLFFNMIHGQGGEDGSLVNWCDQHGLRTVGASFAASALAMDKYRSKLVCQAVGIPTLPGWLVNHVDEMTQVPSTYPLCFKPHNQGSSLGVHCVKAESDVAAAFADSRQWGPVLVEPWCPGRECTVAWVGETLLPVVEIITPRGTFYDYQAKYHSQTTTYVAPAILSQALTTQLQQWAKQAIDAVGCQGWGRVDFLVDDEDRAYLMEINTIPGMSPTSLVPKAAKAHGWSFNALVDAIIQTALVADKSPVQ